MRIVCAYTRLHPLTEAALTAHAKNCERFYVGMNDTSYFELLAELWAAGEGFTLIEHDIEINADTIPAFERCREPWCVCPYPGAGWNAPQNHDPLLYESLGCVRFSDELLAGMPNVMTEVGTISQGLPAKDWRRIDVLLAVKLGDAGYKAHRHDEVRHHHHYPDGCSCGGQHEKAATGVGAC